MSIFKDHKSYVVKWYDKKTKTIKKKYFGNDKFQAMMFCKLLIDNRIKILQKKSNWLHDKLALDSGLDKVDFDDDIGMDEL